MSKTTIRKRLALVASSSLIAAMLSVVSVAPANANIYQATNSAATEDVLGVAVGSNTALTSVFTSTSAAGVTAFRPQGLLYKDPSSATAQTATMLATGTMIFYSLVTATAASFIASGGTFTAALNTSATTDGSTNTLGTFNAGLTNVYFGNAATTVAVSWKPNAPGTYTISHYETDNTTPISASFPTSGTMRGAITVTVLAASAGSTYDASNSACSYSSGPLATPAATDLATATKINGESWFINFNLRDVYNVALPAGVISATATNSALLSLGAAGATAAAGTAPQVVTATSSSGSIRIAQPVANAPVTTSVALSYNGVVVCTKSLTIRGEVAKLAVTVLGTQDINSTTSTGNANLLDDGTGRSASFTVLATDSAGNIVATPSSIGTYSQVDSTISAQITAIDVTAANLATSVSSTNAYRYSTGIYACGPTAGSGKVQIKYLNLVSGKSVTSDPFTAECSDDRHNYTVSLDKQTYRQGDIATMTVKFVDNKGNKANSSIGVGTSTMIMPMMTFVGATGTATSLPNKDGEIKYTLTVGTTAGMTAGTYTGVVNFTALTGAGTAVTATPTYTVTTGGDTTTNADVLKSIVALIASINKQIQALQKLILKR
jgi:hypothetical protein